jgi:hypothetical protein
MIIKPKIRFIDILYWLSIIGANICIYLFLGILQMDYDDNYDSSKGEYWSLESMNRQQLLYYLLLQLWHLLNIIGITFLGRKIYKRIKSGVQQGL